MDTVVAAVEEISEAEVEEAVTLVEIAAPDTVALDLTPLLDVMTAEDLEVAVINEDDAQRILLICQKNWQIDGRSIHQ